MEQNNVVYGETFQVRFLWGRQRHYPRYPLKAPVEFVVKGEMSPSAKPHLERAKGKDISLGGVGVSVPELESNIPPVGARVHLLIKIEGTKAPIVLEGLVAHADPQQGFGIRFMTLTSDLRKKIKRLLTASAVA